jgi:dTDP-4-dehydrorhamnose 3,5-epimerase
VITPSDFTALRLPEVILVKPSVIGDDRGFFMESYNSARYAAHGVPALFVQDNLSRSARGVLRGLHFQNPFAQGKLVSVLEGSVFDVAVDIRQGSPTFGDWVGELLSSSNKYQLYVPPGFAHGFMAISEHAVFAYKCTDYYHPETEQSIRWDDPAIGIVWPAGTKRLSSRDRDALILADMPRERLPTYDA